MVKTDQDPRRPARKKWPTKFDASARHEVSSGNDLDESITSSGACTVQVRTKISPSLCEILSGETGFAAVGYVVLISQSCGQSRRMLR